MSKLNLLMSKFKETIKLQDKFNSKVSNDWQAKNYNWSTCIFVELGEMLASTGYKHWKKETPDITNIKMEVVDVYHFVISECLQQVYNESNENKFMKSITKGLKHEITRSLSFNEITKPHQFLIYHRETDILSLNYFSAKIISLINVEQKGKDSISSLSSAIIELINLVFEGDFEEFLNLYFAKNALNSFRQNNGYKDGTYQKTWGGKEDNEHVAIIVKKQIELFNAESLNNGDEFNAEKFMDIVNSELSLSYPKNQLTPKLEITEKPHLAFNKFNPNNLPKQTRSRSRVKK